MTGNGVLITIDPGKNKHAIAWSDASGFIQKVFFQAADPKKSNINPWPEQASFIRYEMPLVLMKGQTRGKDPNDIVRLALSLGVLLGALGPAYPMATLKEYTPAQWKGSVKKWIHHARIWKYMMPDERRLFPSDTYDRIQRALDGGPYSSEVHNLLDAVALNMFCSGRIGKGGARGIIRSDSMLL